MGTVCDSGLAERYPLFQHHSDAYVGGLRSFGSFALFCHGHEQFVLYLSHTSFVYLNLILMFVEAKKLPLR